MKSTGQLVAIRAFSTEGDGSITCRVHVLPGHNPAIHLAGFDVAGIEPDDLESTP